MFDKEKGISCEVNIVSRASSLFLFYTRGVRIHVRSNLKMCGLDPSVQHATATPGSSYHSGKLPFDLSVIVTPKTASQASRAESSRHTVINMKSLSPCMEQN